METMTPKERIDAVIKHQAVDRTPFTVVDGGAWIAKTEGVTYRELYSRPDSGASSVVDYLNKIDSDMISAVSGVFTACLNAFGCPISIDKIGGAIDTGSVFKDPINEIPQLNRETIRDTLLANDFVQKMINQTRHVKVLVGNQKYIFGDIAGPFTMAAVMVGTSDFIMLMLEEPEIVHELLDFTVCVSAEMFTLLHENGCDIAFPAEPVGSGSLISQEMFEEWVIPSLKKLKEKLPFYKYFYAHVCGASGNRVAALRECGVNVFSVDYLVDFEKAVEAAGEKMVMMGNINPAGTLLTGTPSEVYKEACERIKIANGHSHILAPGCDLGAPRSLPVTVASSWFSVTYPPAISTDPKPSRCARTTTAFSVRFNFFAMAGTDA